MRSREFLRYYAFKRWGRLIDDELVHARVIGHGFPTGDDAA